MVKMPPERQTVPASALGRVVGYLLPDQERALARALVLAFDLDA